jgi:membrane protease YdiL (CAAX protease family)
MQMLLDEIIRAGNQIVVLSVIPFIVWFFVARKKQAFFSWVGLKRIIILEKGKFTFAIVAALAVAVATSFVLDPLLPNDIQLANARFAGKGFVALPAAIVFSFLATALPEEVLFRGFIGQHLSKRLGFVAGNIIQAILFGLLHGAALFNTQNLLLPFAVIAFTGMLGWIMGYVNSKAGDSILPSLVIHGLSNTYASVIIMFSLW